MVNLVLKVQEWRKNHTPDSSYLWHKWAGVYISRERAAARCQIAKAHCRPREEQKQLGGGTESV